MDLYLRTVSDHAVLTEELSGDWMDLSPDIFGDEFFASITLDAIPDDLHTHQPQTT